MKQYIYIAISIFVFCVVVLPVYHKIIEPSAQVLKGRSRACLWDAQTRDEKIYCYQKFGPPT